mmetsp:Transcript_23767/g.64697  ORF Transcript_23767/g.64697 Transcript_23767/m.64697 type:complete len:253 (-) Transcript_23767:886-1644(-)
MHHECEGLPEDDALVTGGDGAPGDSARPGPRPGRSASRASPPTGGGGASSTSGGIGDSAHLCSSTSTVTPGSSSSSSSSSEERRSSHRDRPSDRTPRAAPGKRGASRPSLTRSTSHLRGYTLRQSGISSTKKACRFTVATVPRCSGSSCVRKRMRSNAKSQRCSAFCTAARRGSAAASQLVEASVGKCGGRPASAAASPSAPRTRGEFGGRCGRGWRRTPRGPRGTTTNSPSKFTSTRWAARAGCSKWCEAQ